MGWYGDNGMSAWGWVGMGSSLFLIVALLVVASVVLTRLGRRTPDDPAPPRGHTAEELLAERFARGEIDEEEYRRRLTTLRSALSR